MSTLEFPDVQGLIIVSSQEFEDKPDEEIDVDVVVVESEEDAPTEDEDAGEDEGDAGSTGTE